MNIPIISIGNSKGIRIPKAILNQCKVKEQVEIKVVDNQIVLTPIEKKEFAISFENIPEFTDQEVQLMLQAVDFPKLAISMINSSNEVKKKIFKNMSDRAAKLLKDKLTKLEKMDTKDLLIEIQRVNVVNIFSNL